MTDLEKLLDPAYDWKEQTIDEDKYDELFVEVMLDYLKKHGPDVRQRLVQCWNFDNATEVIQWIVDQPDTDKGTALFLYWYMQPGFSKQYADRAECELKASWHLSSYDLLHCLEERYLANYYIHQYYEFNPKKDGYQNGHDWTSELEPQKMKHSIPDALLMPLEGEILDTPEWDEGVPEELYPVMDRLYELMED